MSEKLARSLGSHEPTDSRMLATSGTLYDGCPRPRFQVPIKVAEMTKCEACDALRGPHRSPGLFAAVHPAKNRLENGLRRARYRMLCQLRRAPLTRLEWAGPRAPREDKP